MELKLRRERRLRNRRRRMETPPGLRNLFNNGRDDNATATFARQSLTVIATFALTLSRCTPAVRRCSRASLVLQISQVARNPVLNPCKSPPRVFRCRVSAPFNKLLSSCFARTEEDTALNVSSDAAARSSSR